MTPETIALQAFELAVRFIADRIETAAERDLAEAELAELAVARRDFRSDAQRMLDERQGR